jgi:mannose-6-phosphate isomerase-like protein (cupin superfamily)
MIGPGLVGPGFPDVRARLLDAFPHCPEETVELFCWLLGQPTQTLAARARISLAKPYGTNHILVTDGDFGVSFACFRPGQGTSLHYHTRRRELFCVRTGELLLVHGETEQRLPAGGIGESTPLVPHSLRNEGNAPLEVLETFTPVLLDDKVRVADRYDRALGPVGMHQ